MDAETLAVGLDAVALACGWADDIYDLVEVDMDDRVFDLAKRAWYMYDNDVVMEEDVRDGLAWCLRVILTQANKRHAYFSALGIRLATVAAALDSPESKWLFDGDVLTLSHIAVVSALLGPDDNPMTARILDIIATSSMKRTSYVNDIVLTAAILGQPTSDEAEATAKMLAAVDIRVSRGDNPAVVELCSNMVEEIIRQFMRLYLSISDPLMWKTARDEMSSTKMKLVVVCSSALVSAVTDLPITVDMILQTSAFLETKLVDATLGYNLI